MAGSPTHFLRTIAASASLAALVVSAFACGGDGDTMTPPDTGGIQGSVVDDISAPVTDLTVALRAVGETIDLATTLTDTLGAFGFTALDPADYNVTLDVPQTYELNGQANPVTARVVAGVTTPLDFTLRLLAGTVTGVVSDTEWPPRSRARPPRCGSPAPLSIFERL